MTTILVDIDGVLCSNNLPLLLSTYNDVLQLNIPADVRVRSVKAFEELPQVQEHRVKVGDKRYQYQLAALKFHPDYIAFCNMIDGARQGVSYLANRCSDLGYCTARVINFHAQWNADLARATHIWLQHNGFPYSDQVQFCDGIKDKLLTITTMIRQREQYVLLIDDSLDKLLSAFNELCNEDQSILNEYLTLVAFGYDACDQEYPLSVIPFPGWHEVHNLAVNLPREKEFTNGQKQKRP